MVTVGLPIVSVPVLSKTTVFTVENLSRTLPPRKSKPLVAPSEVPTFTQKCLIISSASAVRIMPGFSMTALQDMYVFTITAVGVARPSAHGQAITYNHKPEVNYGKTKR